MRRWLAFPPSRWGQAKRSSSPGAIYLCRPRGVAEVIGESVGMIEKQHERWDPFVAAPRGQCQRCDRGSEAPVSFGARRQPARERSPASAATSSSLRLVSSVASLCCEKSQFGQKSVRLGERRPLGRGAESQPSRGQRQAPRHRPRRGASKRWALPWAHSPRSRAVGSHNTERPGKSCNRAGLVTSARASAWALLFRLDPCTTMHYMAQPLSFAGVPSLLRRLTMHAAMSRALPSCAGPLKNPFRLRYA